MKEFVQVTILTGMDPFDVDDKNYKQEAADTVDKMIGAGFKQFVKSSKTKDMDKLEEVVRLAFYGEDSYGNEISGEKQSKIKGKLEKSFNKGVADHIKKNFVSEGAKRITEANLLKVPGMEELVGTGYEYFLNDRMDITEHFRNYINE